MTVLPDARSTSTPCDCETLTAQLCDFLYESLQGLVPFDRVALATFEEGERLVQRAVRANAPDRVIPVGYKGSLRHGTLGAVVASGHPRVLNRLASYALRAGRESPTQMLVEEGYRASLTCPLEHEGAPVGILFFNSRAQDVYRPEHGEVVQRVAQTVARVLAGCQGDAPAGSVAALTRSFAAIGRAAREASEEEVLVARVLDRVREGTTVDDVLDRAFEHFHPLLPYDRVTFLAVEGDRAVVRWSGGAPPSAPGFAQPLAGTMLEAVIEAGAPRITNELAASSGLRSSLTFLLGSQTSPLGFVVFSSRAPGAYRNAHVARMRRITEPLTAAIQKATLYERLARANQRSDALLRMLMPDAVAARLHAGETDIADARDATVLFADLVDFTRWSSALRPIDLLRTLRDLFARYHESAARRGVARIRVMGDGYMAVAGAADAREDHAERAALHALDILDIVRDTRSPDGRPLAARVGIHSGPVVAGVLGGADLRYDVWGPSVSLAARLESHGEPGRVQVSDETARRLAGRFALSPRGDVHLKGLGPIPAWWLEGQAAQEASRCNPLP